MSRHSNKILQILNPALLTRHDRIAFRFSMLYGTRNTVQIEHKMSQPFQLYCLTWFGARRVNTTRKLMNDRREWIPEAHAKTFNWALQGMNQVSLPWSDLKKWLRQEEGIYWVNGKAGSGKSTFMKYIDFDSRTKQYLRAWASPMPLVVASFYFWNPGTSI